MKGTEKNERHRVEKNREKSLELEAFVLLFKWIVWIVSIVEIV